MNFLDARTVIFSQVITDSLCSIVLITFWWQNRKRYAGMFFWVLDFIFQTLAILLIVLRGSIPDWASIGLSSPLVIGGAYLGLLGLERFTGKRSSQIHNYIFLGIFGLVHIYFTGAYPNLEGRNLNVSAGLMVFSFQCAWLMLKRVGPRQVSMTRPIGHIFVLFCLVSAIRIFVILANPQPVNDFFQSGLYDLLILVAYQILLILLSFGQALMINRRLIGEVRSQEEKFVKAFHSSPYAIVISRVSDGLIMDVNRAFEEVTGYHPSEAVGKTTLDLHLWVNETERQQALTELSARGEIHGREYQFRTKSARQLTGLFFAEILVVENEQVILSSISDITERKLAEEKLREDEARFHLALDAARAGAWEWDLLTNENIWSEELWKVYGLEPHSCEPSYEAWMQTIHPDDREGAAQAVQKAAREATELYTEWRVCDRDGTERWLMSLGQPIFDANGQAVRYIGTVLDITERKRAEQALHDSEEKFRKAFITNPDAININRLADGMYVSINRGFSQIMGYLEEEVVGKTSFDLNVWVNPADRKILVDGLSRQGEVVNLEASFRAKNGDIHVGLMSASVFELDNVRHIISITRDITERKKMEGELRKSEDLFSKTFHNSPAPMTIARQTDGTYIEVNEAFLNLVECKREDVIGHTSLDINLIDPEGRSEILNQLHQYGTIHNVEVRARTGTGRRLDILTSIENIELAGEACTIASMLDITQRKQAEEMLRESEERYRTVADYTYDWEYWRAPDGKMLYISPSCERITGYTILEFMEDPGLVDKIVHPDDYFLLDMHTSTVDRSESNRKVHELDFRILRRDGETRWVGHTCQIIRRADGTSLGRRATNRDITERKQAEQMAMENRVKLETALNSMAEAVSISDTQGQFLDFNEAFATFHRFKNKEECSKTFADYPEFLDVYLPDGSLAPIERWAVPRALRGESATNAEYILRRKDTHERWVGSYNFAPIRDKEGVIVGSVVVCRDITDRKRAEEEIQRLNESLELRVRERTAQLEGANKELEAFAYSVSHDLRAPLRGIDGWSYALLEDYHDTLDEMGQNYLNRIRSESQRMGQLIDDLLQLSRVTRTEMQSVQVDLSGLAHIIVARLKQLQPERQVEVTIQPGLSCRGDSVLLGIVLTNLIENAWKFTSRCLQARIEFGETEADGYRTFFVRDNGVGFDMAHAQKLFGAFQRLHKITDYPGTGVGLATVQRIIRRHGGQVWANAQSNSGATFFFTLE